MSGAPGWVASRAGDWSQEKRGERLVELQKYLWNPVTDYWFRKTIEGWENIPKPPTLLIGVHAGAPFVWDTWTVGLQWWRRFGDERPLHGTAHDALMAAPGVGWYFRKMGVLPAAPDSITGALAAGRDVALWPGGEVDSLRPGSAATKPNSPAVPGSFASRSVRGSRSSRSPRWAARTRCPSSSPAADSPRHSSWTS
jgi:1-acyl-sn-glycerol-3-phosphate acyltransferase